MKDTHSKTKGPTIHPILQLEAENAFLVAKSREAKLQTFRAAVGFCQLVTLKECPCGEAGSDLIELTRVSPKYFDKFQHDLIWLFSMQF